MCETPEHDLITGVAWLAVFMYPVGVLLVTMKLLYNARPDILADRETDLVVATSFLHREYKKELCWWEASEIFRRFLLVGLFNVAPYARGTVLQLATATVVCIVYLVVQLSAMPYRTENLTALTCKEDSARQAMLQQLRSEFAELQQL